MSSTDKFDKLREIAKETLKKTEQKLDYDKFGDIDKLIEELNIYRIELELQNKELLDYQEYLHEEKEKYSELYDFAPVGYITLNEDGKIIEINRTAAQLLATKKLMAKSLQFSQFIEENSQDEFYFYMKNIRETHKRQSCEIRMKRSDDSLFYARLESFAIKSGKETTIRMALIDISPEVEVKKKLHESEKKYRLISENVGDVIWTSTEGNTFGYVSPSIEKLTGHTPAELTQQPLEMLLPQHSLKIVQEKTQHQRFLQPDKAQKVFEIQIQKKDGNFVWIEQSLSPMLDASSNYIGMIGIARNIDDRKQAQAALKASEQKYRLLAAGATDIVGMYENDKPIYISPSLREVLGYSPEESKKTDFFEQIHPNDKGRVLSRLKSDIEMKIKRSRYIYRQKHKDGSYRWLETKISFSYPPTGEIISTFNSRDISDRIQVQERLKNSNLRYYLAAQMAKFGIWDYQPQTQKLIWDEGMFRIYERKQTTTPSYRDWLQYILPEDRDFVEKNIENALKQSASTETAFRIRTPNGNIKYIRSYIQFFEKEHLIGLCIDISKRKRAELRLQEAREQLDLALEGGNIAWWVLDCSTHTVEFDKRKAQMLGYTKEEMPKDVSKIMKLLHPDDHEHAMQAMREHLSGERNEYIVDYRIRAKDGSWRWFFDRGRIVQRDHKNKPLKVSGVVVDVSLQKALEEELKSSEKQLRELNATKDRFFSIIAHDLKNPFNQVIGFSELILAYTEKYDKKKIRQFVEIIHQTSQMGFSLLENLLEWSRAQTGKIHFQPISLDLAPVADENIQLMKSTAIDKKIELHSEIQPPAIAFADRDMLYTVLRNLISNALKFTPEGGKVTIRSHQQPQENRLRIEVKDTGIGIPKKIQEKLFSIDHNFSRKGTKNEHGTGLGLILCKEFVERNNGKIWVQSTENKGSSFFFTIPAEQEREEKRKEQ